MELEGELLMFKVREDSKNRMGRRLTFYFASAFFVVALVMGVWLFDANERQVLHSLIHFQRQKQHSQLQKQHSQLQKQYSQQPQPQPQQHRQQQQPAMKSISLTELLSNAVNNSNQQQHQQQQQKQNHQIGLETRLKQEFAEHSFDDLKEFARAVARFIIHDPTTVQSIFEELRK